MRFSPFISQPEFNKEKVGNPETGYIWLLKKFGLSPCENAVDMQALSKKQAKIQAIVFEAIKRYAEKNNVSESDARTAFFDSEVDINPIDYLSFAEKEEYMLLLGDVGETKYKAAALMVKYRLLYPVVVKQRVKANSTTLKIEPLTMPLAKGDVLQFDGFQVEVADIVNFGESELTVKPVPQNIEVDRVGFLVNFETGKLRVGAVDWNLDLTKELLLESQIEAIYAFYQSETGELKATESEATASDDEGNLTPTLTESTATLAPI